MATVSGTATSYDLPQYVGDLFQKNEKPNSVLRLIGGLTGSLRLVTSTEFAMGINYVLPAAAQQSILEAATPSAVEQDTAQATNVVQIFQTAVGLSYSKMGEMGSIDGVAVIPGAGNGELLRPGSVEWQVDKALERLARHINWAFLRGAYQKPANNSTARQTRGVKTAVTTNLFANGGTPRNITKAIFEAALRDMMANGAFSQGDEVFVLGDATAIGNLVDQYEPTAVSGFRPQDTATIVGVNIRTIRARWAVCHLVWEPDMPAGELFLFQPKVCRVTAMPIPSKGVLFVEPLARAGAAETSQLYGELGVDYRDEIFHGLIDDLN